jgi:protease-4
MMLPNVKKLLSEKVGVVFDTVKTHDLAVAGSFVYDPDAKENQIWQGSTDRLYAQFLQRVADGRGMEVDAVNEVAQGRVWTGRKGVEIGLVDKLGDLDDAIESAARMAGLDDYKVVEYPTIKENPFKGIMKAFEEAEASVGLTSRLQSNRKLGPIYRNIKEMETLMQMEGPIARMPFTIETN